MKSRVFVRMTPIFCALAAGAMALAQNVPTVGEPGSSLPPAIAPGSSPTAPQPDGAQLDLDPAVTPFRSGGPGTGRSIYLTANELFSIQSMGILGALMNQSFDVVVYEGHGVEAAPGPALAIRSAVRGTGGFEWNDIVIPFVLEAGKDYIVHWRPTTSNTTWSNDLEYFNWGNSPTDDVDLDLVVIRDGREGHTSGSFANFVAPHMRVDPTMGAADLHAGIAPQNTGGPGTGRSIYLTADEDLLVTEIGILGDLVSQSFDVVVYRGAGVNAAPGPVVATASAVRGGGGFGWNDIPLNVKLYGGSDYIVHWRPTTSNTTWTTNLQYWPNWGNDPNDDVDLGPLTIRDGREGFDSQSFSNSYAPHMRLNLEQCTDLDARVAPQRTGGPGTGRSIYMTADANLTITGVGIRADLVPQSFDVVIYQGAGVGSAPGPVLAMESALVEGGGFGWNDIPIDFTFQAGQDYIVHWRPSTSNSSWTTDLEYWPNWGNSPTDDVDVGPVTIRDGREGFDSQSFSNSYAPHLRLKRAPLGVGCDPCDANCDGAVDAFDIEPFINILVGGGPGCSSCAADVNADGTVDAFDIEPFIECLVGP